MVRVLLAQRLRLRVVLQVVVPIRQTESALIDAGDGLRGVPGVLFSREAEQDGASDQHGAVAVAHDPGKVAERSHVADRGQLRRDRRCARARRAPARPCRRGSSRRSSAGWACGRPPPAPICSSRTRSSDAVVVLHLPVRRPGRLVRRDGVVLHPSAACKLIEVHARVRRPVHRGRVERWRVWQLRVRGCRGLWLGRRESAGLCGRRPEGRCALRGEQGGKGGEAHANQKSGAHSGS